MSILDDLKATTPEQPEPQQEPDPQPEPDAPSQQDWTSIRHSLYGLSTQVADLTTAVNAQSNLLQGLTSQPPGDKPTSTAGIETRLSEIEKTLAAVLTLLDAKTVSESVSKLAAVAERATKATAANSDAVEANIDAMKQAAEKASAAADEVRKRGVAAMNGIATRAVNASVDAVDKRDKAAEERAAKLLAAADKLDERQVWTAVGALALVLLPIAATAVGVVLLVWMFVFGWQAIVDPDAGRWMYWIQVIGWLITAGGGLFAVGGVSYWVAGKLRAWE